MDFAFFKMKNEGKFEFFKNENERDFDFFKVENASALYGKQGGVIFLFSRRRGGVYFPQRKAPPPMTKGKRPCIG